MRSAGLLVFLVLAAPAPASADTLLSFLDTSVARAVGPDGTQVRATSDPVAARVGAGPATVLGPAAGPVPVVVAAGTGGRTAVGWRNAGAPSSLVAVSAPGGTFSAPEEVPGDVIAIRLDERGDAAVRTRIDGADRTAFRPAGGTFGAPVETGELDDIALTATGDTLVWRMTPAGLAVRARSGDGPLSAPHLVGSGSSRTARVVPDGTGRALAVTTGASGDAAALVTAVRAADGTWSESRTTPVPTASILAVDAAANPRGDVVVAVRGGPAPQGIVDPPGVGVWAYAATMSSPDLDGPVLADPEAGGLGADAAVADDGSAVVLYAAGGDTRIARRSGTGAFGAPEPTCSASGPIDTYRDDGQLILGGGTSWYEPDASACASPRPEIRYSKRRLYAGEPVTVDVGSLHYLDWPIESVAIGFEDTTGALPVPTGARATRFRHVFAAPGRFEVGAVVAQHRPAGCCSGAVATNATATVLAHGTLRVPAQRPARRLRVRVSAETYGPKRRVVVRVTGRGRRLGRRAVTAGLAPRTVRVPLRRRAHGPLRVVLRQGGRRIAALVKLTA